MLGFLEMINFGHEIEAHGKKWLSLKYLQDDFHMAVEKDAILPCQIYLVEDNKTLKRTEKAGHSESE
jgi:hypothetical protein